MKLFQLGRGIKLHRKRSGKIQSKSKEELPYMERYIVEVHQNSYELNLNENHFLKELVQLVI